MRISYWSSDVCSSDLRPAARPREDRGQHALAPQRLDDADVEEEEAARAREQQRRTAVAMLGAAKEVALFLARDRARGGDAVERSDAFRAIILHKPLGAETRLFIEALV